MSTISDWVADYGAGDTNNPQTATAIPYPVVNDGNGLAEKLRDIKAVIKSESQNKGWEPDARAATRVSDYQFTLAADVRAIIPVGTAIKLDLGGGSKAVVYLTDIDGAGTLLTVSPSSVAVGLVSARFSALKPGSTPTRNVFGYPNGVGSPLPNRISQHAYFQVSETTATVTVPFMRTERDNGYELLLQAISAAGGSPPNSHYRVIDVIKTTTGFTVIFDGAPSAGVTALWEYAVVWGV